MAGPLSELTIIEMAGLGPGPFAAMMLADHGATVIRIERKGMIGVPNDPLLRSRRSISLDLRREECRAVVRRLALTADGLIEGYRPGVMERLELGPDALIKANPALVYGRVTGWGQYGPLAAEAGHDINYIAITGLLNGIGPKERPVAPGNYLGDYAGGGMMLAFGMVAALLAVQRGGADHSHPSPLRLHRCARCAHAPLQDASQPPAKPAARSPATSGAHVRISDQTRPER